MHQAEIRGGVLGVRRSACVKTRGLAQQVGVDCGVPCGCWGAMGGQGPLVPAAVLMRAMQEGTRPPSGYRPGQVTAEHSRCTRGLLAGEAAASLNTVTGGIGAHLSLPSKGPSPTLTAVKGLSCFHISQVTQALPSASLPGPSGLPDNCCLQHKGTNVSLY